MTPSGDNSGPGREVDKVANPMDESAYLKGLCLCTDGRDCWHGPCQVRRQLRFGMVLVENWAGKGKSR